MLAMQPEALGHLFTHDQTSGYSIKLKKNDGTPVEYKFACTDEPTQLRLHANIEYALANPSDPAAMLLLKALSEFHGARQKLTKARPVLLEPYTPGPNNEPQYAIGFNLPHNQQAWHLIALEKVAGKTRFHLSPDLLQIEDDPSNFTGLIVAVNLFHQSRQQTKGA